LAHHFAQAGLIERAVDYLLKAGQRSIEHSANVGAIGHLTHALELLQGLPDAPQRKHASEPHVTTLSLDRIGRDQS
jgi:predicted ATPase